MVAKKKADPKKKHRAPMPAPSRRPVCCLCGRQPCMRLVGTKGYCAFHTGAAFEAAGGRRPGDGVDWRRHGERPIEDDP